jgi:hypothetical protein
VERILLNGIKLHVVQKKQKGGISMRKRSVSIVLCAVFVALSFFIVTTVPIYAAGPTMAGEKEKHPRIVKAIHAIEDAIAYLKAAPHDFGGHRAAAIADCEKAVVQLKEALKYREVQDKGTKRLK